MSYITHYNDLGGRYPRIRLRTRRHNRSTRTAPHLEYGTISNVELPYMAISKDNNIMYVKFLEYFKVIYKVEVITMQGFCKYSVT